MSLEHVSLTVVTRLFERDSFEAGVDSIVDAIASGSTAALSASKDLLDRSHRSLSVATDDEERAQATLLGTSDHAEGATAFVERRKPEFDGRWRFVWGDPRERLVTRLRASVLRLRRVPSCAC